MTSRKKRYLLFLPFLLLVIVKESFASNEGSEAKLDNSELKSRPKSNEAMISTEPLKADATTNSNLGSETILHSQEDSFTTISDLTSKGDLLVTESPTNEKLIPETTEASHAAVNSEAAHAAVNSGAPQAAVNSGAPQAAVNSEAPQAAVNSGAPQAAVNSEAPQAAVSSEAPHAAVNSEAPHATVDQPHDITGKDADIDNSVKLKEADKEELISEDTVHDSHSKDSNNLPSNILFKRILTSEDNSEPINLDEVPETRLDSWRPLWNEEHLTSHDLNPTAKFPDFKHPQNSYIESSFQAKPNAPETFGISKEPVTAYYFDLSSVLPTIPIGPLYDPSYLAAAHNLHNTPEPHKTGLENHDNPHLNLENTFVHPVHDESIYFPNENEKINIEPTPTLPDNVEEERETHPEFEKNHTEKELEEVPSMMTKSDSLSVISLYNKTTDDLQNSTPSYTLGNSTDFKFKQNEQILPKNSTNLSEVVNLSSSTLSSENPMDLHSITVQTSSIGDTLSRFPEMPGSSTSGFENNKTDSADINNLEGTQEWKEENDPVHTDNKNSVEITESEYKNNITDVIDTVSHPLTKVTTPYESHPPVDSTTTTSSTTSTTTTSTPSTTTPMSTTTTTTSTTTPTSSTTTTEEQLTHDYVPENLEFIFPTNLSSPSNVTFYIPKGENDSLIAQEANEKPIKFVVLENEGEEPVLKLITLHKNGTNTTEATPYIKVAVSYNLLDFCQHNKNIRSLLQQWITKHMSNFSQGDSFEIEVFHQPDCENLYLHPDLFSELGNKTTIYFYVKQNGEISPNSTLNYPRNPTNLEISQELDYLKNRITHLELMNASTSEERLIEEAAVGTSIVVIVVVTTLLIIILISGILAFFVIKKRRAAESMHGRRCTPATTDAYSLDSVSVFYHSLRRKSKKRASNKSLKSYLNQGFDDPNLPSRPLNFNKLTHFISDNEAIYEEFSNIPTVVPKYDEMPKGVEDKNRYANVIPVPETRILLEDNKATPSEQYINANSIHGPKGELRYYVATQAPLENTVADFWQMVWEQESRVIVMLTDFVEKGVDKCADYLPPSETLDCHRVYGDFQITLKSRDMREKYIVSILQIKNLENNLVREIAHMWYTGWPQTGVPMEEKLFISFIFDVRTTRKQLRTKGPIIVHCSPGTGRTGTYIACDLCMRQFDEQKVIDIPKTVFRIRRERAGAVQTKEQYSFIYRVVNLYASKVTTGQLDSF